jgi:transposase
MHHRYRWLYLYGFVQPAAGKVLWYIMPTATTEAMSRVLAAFAADADLGPDRQVLLALDRAGWHIGADLHQPAPAHLHLTFLPPCSPEPMPAERLWPLVNEAVANRCFDNLTAMSGALEQRCLTLAKQVGLIRGCTLFHWWPSPKSPEVTSRI